MHHPEQPLYRRRAADGRSGRGTRGALAALVTAGVAMATALVAPSGASGQSRSMGPLAAEEGAPLQRIAFTAVAEEADPVSRGALRADLWLGYSNIFEQDSSAHHVLMVDMERLISTVGVRYGLTDRIEVGGRLTFESTGAGALDRVVSWWHNRLGVGNANREKFPEDDYDYRLEDGAERVLLHVPRSRLALEEVRLFAKWAAAVSEDGRRALSLRGAVRLPTRFGSVGEEGTDVAASALARISFERWHLHGMVGASTIRASGPLATLLRDGSYHLMVGVEHVLGDSWSAVAQYSLATPVLESVDRRKLDWASGNLVVGLAGRVGEDWGWDVSFQEDVPAETPAVDFTFGFGLSRSW